jgi:hypothetical protein
MNPMFTRTALILIQVCAPTCSRAIHPIHAESGQGFASLFDGFVYVGVDVDQNSHTNSGLEMPDQVSPDHEYVFHHERPFEVMQFARSTLPRRLQSLGFTVTRDVDHGTIVDMDPGGALWGVRFARGACTGVVVTRRCLDLTSRKLFKDSRWGESDFVLTLHGQCAN